jgi:peptide/nickel transport system permease protein
MPMPASMTSQTDLTLAANQTKRQRHLWKTLLRNKRVVVGGFIVIAVCLLAITAPLVTRNAPNFGNYSLMLTSPNEDNFFGTDGFGRDVFSRVIYGLRISMIVAFVSVVPAVAIGVPLGLIAGYKRGIIDNLIMRPLDLMISFPPILLAITLVAMFGTRLSITVASLTLIWMPIMTRILRGSVLSVRSAEFVEAARTIGASPARVTIRHVLPNSLGPLIVQASISMGISILIEASLSFVGLGTQPPNPSLGGMLAENKDFMRVAPWTVIFPGLSIMIIVLGFNLFGDGLRDIVASRRRR